MSIPSKRLNTLKGSVKEKRNFAKTLCGLRLEKGKDKKKYKAT